MEKTTALAMQEHERETGRLILGILLFILVLGIWTYLWVPPLLPL